MAPVVTDKSEQVSDFRAMIQRGTSGDVNMVSIKSTGSKYVERNSIAATSTRYRDHAIFLYKRGDRTFRVVETWEAPVVPTPFAVGERYFEVSRGYRARPDLIALTTLGNKFDWWWILYANGIVDSDTIEAGTTLRIPRPPYQQPMSQRF